jgi:hypothetical protein
MNVIGSPFVSTLFLLLFSALLFAQPSVTLLRDRAPEDRPTLLVLGSAHFANPGRDLINVDVEDVLSERRQTEIEGVVEQLARFRPTHVAVEVAPSSQAELDVRYRAYLEGRHVLSRNEVEQLGFRLAAAAEHGRVFAIDTYVNSPGDREDYDWYNYAQAHDQDRLAALSDPDSSGVIDIGEHSIGAWLRELNTPEALLDNHRMYFDIALIGDEERHVGANWVGHWYARNLKIFENVVRLTDQPGDRIVVIYGAGHAYLLRQFAVESRAFRLVDVDDVLTER